MFSNKLKTKTLLLVAVVLIGLALMTAGQTTMAVTTRVRVSNTSCKGPVGISKFTFQRGGFPIGIKVLSPPRSVELDQTRTFTFELDNRPTAVTVGGRDDREREFSVRVEMGEREEYRCGQISVISEGEQPPPEEDQQPQPGQGQARLPSRLQGISPGSSPQEVLNQLRRSGADLEVQGSRNNPKLGNVADPMLIGSLGSGFTATAYWVNGPGQLRSVVTWDRPSSSHVLLVVSNTLNFCASVTPGSGGIEVSCDAPATTEPLTTIGNAPVPGNTFLVVAVKLSGPAQQYVLSLSG
ncbi:MAG: hypothetical protein V5A87_05550 [Candidatus Bipolaricaulota bacterium]|nr:hypothetical protein [Candidatus Bipolaricaulota bacterium]MBS3792002.1 hypothetical protein [Candidatus Bipolaricaulota bacterium]